MNEKIVLFLHGWLTPATRRRLAGVRETAGARGWLVVPVDVTSAGPPKRLLASWKPDGAIAEGVVLRRRGWSPAAFGDLPVVFCDADPARVPGRHFGVRHDSVETALVALRELLSLKLGAYAYANSRWRLPWSLEREALFKRETAAAGVEARVFRPWARRSALNARAALERLETFLLSLPRPCGMLVANDEMGELVLLAARRIGLEVPWDLAVASIDDDEEICEFTSPPLTSVAPEFAHAGRMAAELLAERLENPAAPPRVLSFGPGPLSRRLSTRRDVRRDSVAAQAMERVRRDACSGLSAGEITRATGLPIRTAQLRFRAAAGRSIRSALVAERVARARKLLADPRKTILEVALACGWRDERAFRAAFTKETGLSPGRWRRDSGK